MILHFVISEAQKGRLAVYTNNIKSGTAKVTLRGIGSYGGTRVLPYRIIPKQGSFQGVIIDGGWK